jgi:hypothetical protein
MPRNTEWQALTDTLLERYTVHRYAECFAYVAAEILAIDDEEHKEHDDDDDYLAFFISGMLLQSLRQLYTTRYLEKHVRILKSTDTLHLILTEYKKNRPNIFCTFLWVSPTTFDALLAAICKHPVFENDSQNEQAPVEIQLAIALHRFGHFGNAASLLKVGIWAGIGWGTVDLYTRHVMVAVCSDRFQKSAIRWPNEEEKAIAKEWVASQSCPAWADSFVMVDGTCAVLHSRLAFYGNSFYDQKQKYSLNVQVCLVSVVLNSESDSWD